MDNIINRINQFYNIKELNADSLTFISNFESDGEYLLASDEEKAAMPIDVRWDVSVHSTYHACYLLLKYYNEGNKEVFPQLKRCFCKCLAHRFEYEGFASEESTINTIINLLT